MLIGTEEVLLAERPDAVLVLGDTNSCIAAVMAKRMRIPTYHMEAGNRCFDENVPEETNRRLVDHVADFNLVYTEHARRNLLAEGLHPRRILVTGSPMREVLEHYRAQIEASDVLDRLGLDGRRATSLSAPTARRTSTPRRGCAAARLPERGPPTWDGLPFVVSTHPRTRKRLEALGAPRDRGRIRLHGAVRLPRLQPPPDARRLRALRLGHDLRGVVDPGLPRGDAAGLDRAPRGAGPGSIMMTGLDPDDVVRAVAYRDRRRTGDSSMPAGYEVGDTSNRVVRFIVSTASRHHDWGGIRG